jgi:hypothetical protein
VIAFAHQRTGDYSSALAILAIAPATLAILVLLVPAPNADRGVRT